MLGLSFLDRWFAHRQAQQQQATAALPATADMDKQVPAEISPLNPSPSLLPGDAAKAGGPPPPLHPGGNPLTPTPGAPADIATLPTVNNTPAHEMTRKQYRDEWIARLSKLPTPQTPETYYLIQGVSPAESAKMFLAQADKYHKEAILAALVTGTSIKPEILTEYPDLEKRGKDLPGAVENNPTIPPLPPSAVPNEPWAPIAETPGAAPKNPVIDVNKIGKGAEASIHQDQGKWVVMSDSGRHMGTYDTEAEAIQRLRQTEHYNQQNKAEKAEKAAVASRVVQAYIEEHKGRWIVYSHAGKQLGTYGTKDEAVKRLRAIEYFKNHKAQCDVHPTRFSGTHAMAYTLYRGDQEIEGVLEYTIDDKDESVGIYEPSICDIQFTDSEGNELTLTPDELETAEQYAWEDSEQYTLDSQKEEYGDYKRDQEKDEPRGSDYNDIVGTDREAAKYSGLTCPNCSYDDLVKMVPDAGGMRYTCKNCKKAFVASDVPALAAVAQKISKKPWTDLNPGDLVKVVDGKNKQWIGSTWTVQKVANGVLWADAKTVPAGVKMPPSHDFMDDSWEFQVTQPAAAPGGATIKDPTSAKCQVCGSLTNPVTWEVLGGYPNKIPVCTKCLDEVTKFKAEQKAKAAPGAKPVATPAKAAPNAPAAPGGPVVAHPWAGLNPGDIVELGGTKAATAVLAGSTLEVVGGGGTGNLDAKFITCPGMLSMVGKTYNFINNAYTFKPVKAGAAAPAVAAPVAAPAAPVATVVPGAGLVIGATCSPKHTSGVAVGDKLEIVGAPAGKQSWVGSKVTVTDVADDSEITASTDSKSDPNDVPDAYPYQNGSWTFKRIAVRANESQYELSVDGEWKPASKEIYAAWTGMKREANMDKPVLKPFFVRLSQKIKHQNLTTHYSPKTGETVSGLIIELKDGDAVLQGRSDMGNHLWLSFAPSDNPVHRVNVMFWLDDRGEIDEVEICGKLAVDTAGNLAETDTVKKLSGGSPVATLASAVKSMAKQLKAAESKLHPELPAEDKDLMTVTQFSPVMTPQHEWLPEVDKVEDMGGIQLSAYHKVAQQVGPASKLDAQTLPVSDPTGTTEIFDEYAGLKKCASCGHYLTSIEDGKSLCLECEAHEDEKKQFPADTDKDGLDIKTDRIAQNNSYYTKHWDKVASTLTPEAVEAYKHGVQFIPTAKAVYAVDQTGYYITRMEMAGDTLSAVPGFADAEDENAVVAQLNVDASIPSRPRQPDCAHCGKYRGKLTHTCDECGKSICNNCVGHDICPE